MNLKELKRKSMKKSKKEAEIKKIILISYQKLIKRMK